MTYTDEELHTLREQFCNKSNTESKLRAQRIKLKEIEERLKPLEAAKLKEEEDVERLEKVSLASFFYSLTGQKVEQLNKEREEAYAAELKYEAVYKEYNAVCENIAWLEGRLVKMADYEREYERAINEKINILKETGNSAVDEINRLEALQSRIIGKLNALDEVIAAGDEARTTASKLVFILEEAERIAHHDFSTSTGTRKVYGAKMRKLDVAQSYVETLRTQLDNMRTGLVDISVPTDIRTEIHYLDRLFDKIFDAMLADWIVLDKIRKSLEQAKNTSDKLETVCYRLTVMREELTTDRNDVKEQLNELVLGTKI